MLARSSRRLTVAVALALIAHATVLYLATRVGSRADLSTPASAPLRIQLRITSARAVQAPSTDLAPSTADTDTYHNRVTRHTERATGTSPAVARPVYPAEAEPAEPAAPTANSPRFDSDRAMQQAIRADRQLRAQRQAPLWATRLREGEHAASSPFDALGGNQAAARVESSTDSRGTRVEKVTTLGGGYCVTTPNAATAYRHENGLNLSGAGNCPR